MAAKGSIILKLLIVVCALALWQVISLPGKIWSEEQHLEKTSRDNMNSIYEAQMYYYGKTKRFMPEDSLEYLVDFIKSDSALNQRQKIGRLTHVLNDSVNRILDVPTIRAMIPISSSLREISGDLEFNTRYFERHDNIMEHKAKVVENLNKITASAEFPNFSKLRNYIDSLSTLQERMNEYKLQNVAQMAQRYVDSMVVYLPKIEMDRVQSYWSGQYSLINDMVKDIKKTDIMQVSSVADRLKKFIDRINTAMSELATLNRQQDVNTLQKYKSGVGKVYNTFLEPDNFLTTENNGIMQLNEIDSILVKLDKSNFYDPDVFDGEQKYLVSYEEGSSNLTVESPNLLDNFQNELKSASQPLMNIPFVQYIDQIHNSLDSTIKVMDDAKNEYRLSRYSTDILLGIKEVSAEMKDLGNIKFYRYVTNFKNFVDKVNNEKRLSVMKPVIEDILNPMDTLAARIKTKDVSDLVERMNYFDTKTKQLDSLIQNNNKIPAKVKRDVPSFSASFQNVYSIIEEMKSSFNAADADQMVASAKEIEKALLETLNGQNETVHYVFSKSHENHGYIENGQKSWEAE